MGGITGPNWENNRSWIGDLVLNLTFLKEFMNTRTDKLHDDNLGDHIITSF